MSMRPAGSATATARGFRRWLPALFFVFLVVPAAAPALEIQPVLAEVAANESSTSFTLRNRRDTPLRLQIDALDWRQDGRDESLTPSVELIVVPRVASIAPGASQRVRVALRGGGDRARERAHRLVFREIPPPPEPGFTGLRTRLEVSVPVFFLPAHASPPAPAFRAQRGEDGTLLVTLANQGGRHARFSSLRLTWPDGALLGEASGVFYALAGGGRQVPLRTHSLPPAGSELRLVVVADGREESHPLHLE